MATLAFLTAVYNERAEIEDLIDSVRPYVDAVVVSDDGSTDDTPLIALKTGKVDVLVLGPHLASCEEVRIRGFDRVNEDWILILDADERISAEGMQKIREFIDSDPPQTHVYFSQKEYIGGQFLRDFAKIKLARFESLHLPTGIHDDIWCDGDPINIGVEVVHRKTWEKQVQREREYLDAYERKVAEGKMTPERAAQVSQWHYVVRSKDQG